MQLKAPAREFPPLERVRRDLRVKWYRCPIEPAKLARTDAAQRPAGRLPDARPPGAVGRLRRGDGLVLHAGHVAAVRGSRCGARARWGTFLRGLGTHELGHGTVFRTKWLNKFFLVPMSMLTWWSYHEYAMSHTYHHRYTLYPEGDREGGVADRPAAEAAADPATAHLQHAGHDPDRRRHRAHGHSPLPPRPDQHPHQRVDRGAVQGRPRGGAQGGALRPPHHPVPRIAAGGVGGDRRLVAIDRVHRLPVLRQLAGRPGGHPDAHRPDWTACPTSACACVPTGSIRSRRSCTGA